MDYLMPSHLCIWQDILALCLQQSWKALSLAMRFFSGWNGP
jgi:hypothetical protein